MGLLDHYNELTGGPGGKLMAGDIARNALTKSNIENKYLPMTSKAEAASKMAYANLMGPQFLAKLMGNSDVVANSPQLQDASTIQRLYQAATGAGTGNALTNMPGDPDRNTNSLSNWMTDRIKSIFGGEQSPNALTRQPSQGNVPAGNMQKVTAADRGYDYNSDGTNVIAQPKEISATARSSNDPVVNFGDGMTGTLVPQVGTGYTPEMAAQQQGPKQTNGTYAENAGGYKGTIAELEEAGKIRAKDIEDLNNHVFNAETSLSTLNDIGDILSSPEFEQIRQVPLAGRHELAYYAKEGTPEQQQMVGKYYALTGNLVKDASRDFAGSFRKGEQTLLEGMKPSPGDTVDTAKGKTESITYLLNMLKERSQMTSELMSKYHINKGQASDIADKRINGQKIRESVHDKLNPTVTVRNKKTGEVKTISGSEARKLGASNV